MNNASYELGAGDTRDLDAVMRVMVDSFDPAFGEGWSGPQCAGLLPMPGVWLALAREQSEVVGFALARTVAQEAELLLLAVKKKAQGQGCGKALLNRFIDEAASRGAEKLYLEVRDGNSAVRLYNSFGFTEVGRRDRYYTGRDGQAYDSLTLSKNLAHEL